MSLTSNIDNNLTQIDPKSGLDCPAPEEEAKMASSQIPSNSTPYGEPSSEVAAEAAANESSEDDGLLNKQHFTRSKNPVKSNSGSAVGVRNGVSSSFVLLLFRKR